MHNDAARPWSLVILLSLIAKFTTYLPNSCKSEIMSPKLYMMDLSPPARGVMMVAKAIGLDLELVPVNLLSKEQLKPEYLKINPQHTVPTLVDDDGFTVWDSHAIMTYLVSKYSKGSPLLPNDLKQRTVVDQRLHFDSGVLFARFASIGKTLMLQVKKSLDETDKDSLNEAYDFLEKFLVNKAWIAGDNLTVADYSLISTISSTNLLVPVDSSKFPRLVAWMKKMEGLPAYEANKNGLQSFAAVFKSLLV